jgi:carboxylesterase
MAAIQLPKPFQSNEHRDFLWPGGDCSVLLVHGFPGSPAEMRPLGNVLREAGWTVHGLMLPGLGADIENLERTSFHDWSRAVTNTVEELKRQYSVLLVVGYSIGALALRAAAEHRFNGLILLAPFWSIADRPQVFFWPVIRRLFRRIKPLKGADFSNPEIRRSLERMFGSINLNDLSTQVALRQISVSLKSIEQLRQLGAGAFARAPEVTARTLIIQGSRDDVVPAPRTRRLIGRFARAIEYHEVDAGHDLVNPEGSAWCEVKSHLELFAEKIRFSRKRSG